MPFTRPPTPNQITIDTTGQPAWLATVESAINAVLQPGSGGVPPGTQSLNVTLTASQFGLSSFAPQNVSDFESKLLNEYRAAGWQVQVFSSISNPPPPNGDGQATSITYTFTRFQT